MSVSTKYKDQTIAQLSESGTVTLETAGKYCEDNITVEYAADSAVTGNSVISLTLTLGEMNENSYGTHATCTGDKSCEQVLEEIQSGKTLLKAVLDQGEGVNEDDAMYFNFSLVGGEMAASFVGFADYNVFYLLTADEGTSWSLYMVGLLTKETLGNLDDLTTTDKSNLVAAINEAATKGSGVEKTSQLENDSGFITLADLPVYNGEME